MRLLELGKACPRTNHDKVYAFGAGNEQQRLRAFKQNGGSA